jgi:hypothetical protein
VAGMRRTIRVVVVDDDPLVRAALTDPQAAARRSAPVICSPGSLPGERDVAVAIAQGKANAEIAPIFMSV